MIKVDGQEIVFRETQWGVEYESTDALLHTIFFEGVEDESREDARAHQAMFGGAVVYREVFYGKWIKAD